MDRHVIGIDIGGTMIKGAVFNARGSMIEKQERSSMADTTEEKFINNLVSFIKSLTGDNSNISATGIGIAGVLDKQRNILIESPNIPVLRNINLKDTLEKRLMMPVVIENDANIAALGELWIGNGRTEIGHLPSYHLKFSTAGFQRSNTGFFSFPDRPVN